MSEDRNPADATDGRDPKTGKFLRGNPGRRRGARNRTTRAAETLLQRDAKGLTAKAIELGLGGDVMALRLCLERLVPAMRPGDRHLDPIALPAAPAEALDAIIEAVGCGDLLLADAERLAGLVKVRADLASIEEIERRLQALEGATTRQ